MNPVHLWVVQLAVNVMLVFECNVFFHITKMNSLIMYIMQYICEFTENC